MTPEAHKALMDSWRQELQRTNYHEAPPVRGFYRDMFFAGAHFRCRVMKRLQERGWLLKQIAYIWGISTSAVGSILTCTSYREVPTALMEKHGR